MTTANPQTAPNRLNTIVGLAIALALLYFTRDVLIPITLAIVLSVFVAPLVRGLRRVGLGRGAAVAFAVLSLIGALSLAGLGIGAQLARLGSSLPQYESTLRSKLKVVDEFALARLSSISGQADRMMNGLPTRAPVAATLIPVEIHQPQPRPIDLLFRLGSSVSRPLEAAGVVLIVLVFVLLEHETLQDRFIRLVGGRDPRAIATAVRDAGERLSHFFLAQLVVNLIFGLIVWVGLTLAGLPQAFLWGAMAAMLRFVPYIGIWIAALCATALALVIVPGWTLAIVTLGLFFTVDIVISQLVEPHLYGRTIGVTPLAVVIGVIFWGWIWGPVGLILSTPLTLCLAMASRYVPGLAFWEILLGDVAASSLPETLPGHRERRASA